MLGWWLGASGLGFGRFRVKGFAMCSHCQKMIRLKAAAQEELRPCYTESYEANLAPRRLSKKKCSYGSVGYIR